MRTIKRHANGGATVSLVVRERPWGAVVADMIDGFVVVNDDAERAGELRNLLWAAIEQVDVSAGQRAAVAPAQRAGGRLQAVPPAA